MMHRARIAVLFEVAVPLVLIFALARPAGAREADRVGGTAVVRGTGGRLNVRAGPGASFAVVGVLPEGARVEILGGPRPVGREDWYRVRRLAGGDRPIGWVVGTYLVAEPKEPGPRAGRTFVAEVRAYASGGDVGASTATGTPVRWGTVAVDPRYVALGSLLAVEGLDGVFVAEDVGGTIRGAQLDIWFPDRESALRWGVQSRRVTVLREGY